MRTISVDTEYDYKIPFLATITDDLLHTSVYRLKVLLQKKGLKKICEDPCIRKVFHNATGDIWVLRNIGINVVPPYEDTMIVSNLIDENFSSRNLKKLAEGHLDVEHPEANRLKSTIKKYKQIAEQEGRQFRWSDIPDEVMIPYAKRDPEDTIQLWFYWKVPLLDYRKLYEFEKKLIPIIVDMQWKGMRINRLLCKKRGYEYGKKIKELYEKMNKFIVDNNIDLGGKEFNPNSHDQIGNIVLQLDIETPLTAKTRMPKVDKDQLVLLKNEHPFFDLLVKYRFFTKHKGTYYDSLYEYYTSNEDDRAHFMLYQTGAKSGRFSAELVQTFPRPGESKASGEKHEVRNVVIPGKGKVLLCKDYEQMEFRLFCHFSNCKRMIDIINKKGGRGLDGYLESANVLFGKSMENEKYRKPLRDVTKHNMLGMIFGQGTAKLLKSVNHLMIEKFDKEVIEQLGMDMQWAYDVLQKIHELYPIRQFMREETSKLYRYGYTRLEFHSSLMNFVRDYRVPQEKAYKAVNIKIQGTAAYVIKHAMVRIDERIKKEGWQRKVDMLMQVHDELIFEVDEDMDLNHVDGVLTEEMEDDNTFKIPLTCTAKWSDISWGNVIDL